MAKALFKNNAASTLAGSITNVAVTANLSAGTGALFPNPNTATDEYFVLTLTDQATGLLNEIVHVTARSGDTITMVRAQEGTTALAWSAGDLATMLYTAGTAEVFSQELDSAVAGGIFLADTGVANAIEITFPAFITSAESIEGAPVRISLAADNTGATIVSVVGDADYPLLNPDGSEMASGQLRQNSIITAVFSIGSGAYYLQSITGWPVPERGRHVINSGSSTYAVPATANWWTVTATGGGGGGAGGDGTFAGGGGGAGGTAIIVMNAATAGTRTITYSVGAGGTGGVSSGGGETAGGTTTVSCGGYSLSATGGNPGVHSAAPAGGVGGTPTGVGAQLLKGGAGTDGAPSGGNHGGNGGASYWGGGGRASTATSASVQDGAAPGSGGGGGYGGASVTGGAGAAGCLVIEYGA